MSEIVVTSEELIEALRKELEETRYELLTTQIALKKLIASQPAKPLPYPVLETD